MVIIVDDKIAKLITKSLWVALILFVIRYFVCDVSSLYDFIGAAGEVISFTIILMGFYCSLLWKYNPLEKTPKLMGTYKGTIKYTFGGVTSKKATMMEVKQTLLSIKIKITTNEITSNTIVGNLVEENV